MKLHKRVVEHLLQLCMNLGGAKEETKLEQSFRSLRLSPYIRQENAAGDPMVLVETLEYLSERQKRNQPTADIVPMKFHATAIQKLLYLWTNHGGHTYEKKLRTFFENLEFTPYTTKTTGETFLIPTDEYMKALQQGNK